MKAEKKTIGRSSSSGRLIVSNIEENKKKLTRSLSLPESWSSVGGATSTWLNLLSRFFDLHRKKSTAKKKMCVVQLGGKKEQEKIVLMTTEEEKGQAKKKKKKSKWSSWLPDPERRWPVQGW